MYTTLLVQKKPSVNLSFFLVIFLKILLLQKNTSSNIHETDTNNMKSFDIDKNRQNFNIQ